jgi:hypothetical protein
MRVISKLSELGSCLRCERDLNMMFGESRLKTLDLNFDDLIERISGERLEGEYLIKAVKELRPKVLAKRDIELNL